MTANELFKLILFFTDKIYMHDKMPFFQPDSVGMCEMCEMCALVAVCVCVCQCSAHVA